jgi:hypothetical protein
VFFRKKSIICCDRAKKIKKIKKIEKIFKKGGQNALQL